MDKQEKEHVKEIKKQAVKDRKVKKALRVKSFRGLKNFIWWLSGVLSSFAILAGTIFVAVGVLPVGTYFGGKEEEMVSENVSSKSILDVFKSIGDLQVSDFKILQDTVDRLFEEGGIDEFITLDRNKLSELKFVYEEGSEKTFGTEIQNCIKISKNLFGDLVDIGIFEHAEVPVDDVPTPEQEFTPSLYYYVSSGSVSEGTAVYSRAFNDDKTRVEDSNGKTLYYVALDYLPFGEMKNLIADRLGQVQIQTLLTALGNDMEDSLIGDILGDVKVNGIGAFDMNGIKLNLFLPDKDEHDQPYNTELYKILCGAIQPKPEREESEVTSSNLTIGDLTGATGTFSMNGIKLNSIMAESGNEALYDILCGAVKRNDNSTATASDITIGDLTGATGTFDMDGIKLSAIVPYEDEYGTPTNTGIYDMLCDAIVRTDNSEVLPSNITIGDLTGKTGTFNLNEVALASVLTPSSNAQFYSILRDLTATTYNSTTVTDYTVDKHNELIKINDLQGRDFSVIHLSCVLGEAGNESLYGILEDLTGKSADEIRVSDLNGIETNDIKLSSVIPCEDEYGNKLNEQLYDVLCGAITRSDSSVVTPSNVTIGDLTGATGTFKMDSVKLVSVIPCEDEHGNAINTQLYDILYDITGNVAEDITVGSLSGFDVSQVRLATVLPPTTGNASLYKVIRDLTKEEYNSTTISDYTTDKHNNAVLLADLQTIEINDLSLTSVLEDNTANAKIYSILCEATGKTANDQITVGSLSSFEIGSVRLQTVIDKDSSDIQNNKILKALLEDETATVDHLGEKVNDLDISVLYEGSCFTTDKSKANVNTVGGTEVVPATYKKITVVNDGVTETEAYILENVYNLAPTAYTLTDNQTYYVSKAEAHIWLFLLYDHDFMHDDKNPDGTKNETGMSNDHDEYGNAVYYQPFHHKLSAMQEDVDHISEEIMNSKIRQLADAGVIDDGESGYKDNLYKLSMGEALYWLNANI